MPGLAVAGLLQWQAGPAEQDTAPPGRGTLPAGAWVHLQRRVGGLGLTLLLCRRGHPALHSRRSRHSRRSGEEERAPPAPGARARSAGGTPWLGVRCRSLMSSPAPVPQAHTLLPVCRPYLLEDEGLHDCWVGDLHGTRHSHSIFTPLRGHSAQQVGLGTVQDRAWRLHSAWHESTALQPRTARRKSSVGAAPREKQTNQIGGLNSTVFTCG